MCRKTILYNTTVFEKIHIPVDSGSGNNISYQNPSINWEQYTT